MRPAPLLLSSALPGSILGAVLLLSDCGHRPEPRLRLSGNIEVVQVEASFRLGGRVLERPVDEGQIVQAGQLLARLEAKDLEQTVAMRKADAATARAALDALLAGSRNEEIEAARAKVRQADQQATLVQKGPRKEDIDQGRARLDQATQALALAQTQLGYATLLAPTSGVILSKNIEPMEFVSPGTSVLTMANLGQVWLRAYVEEGDLGRVKVGQKARVSSDTYPGKQYEGRVSFIASEAEFTPKSVQTRKERAKLVYRIKIEIPNPAMELKPGMPVDVEIELGGR